MFNTDGSDGQLCLNGARCAANYLYKYHNYPNQFELTMGEKTITNTIEHKNETITITQKIPTGAYLGEKRIAANKRDFLGHIVDIGNPHFIVFEQTDRKWLEHYGRSIEQHKAFPNKTNVEFIWPHKTKKNAYHILVYERGCGVTQACSSAAAAVTQLLRKKKRVRLNEPVNLCMLGGVLTGLITKEQQISLCVTYAPDNMAEVP